MHLHSHMFFNWQFEKLDDTCYARHLRFMPTRIGEYRQSNQKNTDIQSFIHHKQFRLHVSLLLVSYSINLEHLEDMVVNYWLGTLMCA